MANPLSPQQRRYLALLDALLEEEGGPDRHGAKKAAGDRLGISGHHVSQLLDGSKQPGETIISRVSEEKRLVRASYFTDPGPPKLDYRKYDPKRRRTETPEDAIPAAWTEAEEDGTIDGYRRAGVDEGTLSAIRGIPGARGGAMTREELISFLDTALTNVAKSQMIEPEEARRARERVEPDLAHRIKKPRPG